MLCFIPCTSCSVLFRAVATNCTAQDEAYETPMQPITMLRNALGKEEGGSGVPLDRAQYEASVAYWDGHAPVVEAEKPNGE